MFLKEITMDAILEWDTEGVVLGDEPVEDALRDGFCFLSDDEVVEEDQGEGYVQDFGHIDARIDSEVGENLLVMSAEEHEALEAVCTVNRVPKRKRGYGKPRIRLGSLIAAAKEGPEAIDALVPWWAKSYAEKTGYVLESSLEVRPHLVSREEYRREVGLDGEE
jgi:hypothetical protein